MPHAGKPISDIRVQQSDKTPELSGQGNAADMQQLLKEAALLFRNAARLLENLGASDTNLGSLESQLNLHGVAVDGRSEGTPKQLQRRKRPKKTVDRRARPGVIRADAWYTLEEFELRTNLGTAARREMRDDGFEVARFSKYGSVLGSDFIAYVKSRQQRQSSDNGSVARKSRQQKQSSDNGSATE